LLFRFFIQNEVWGGFLALFLTFFAFLGLTFFFLAKVKAENPEKWPTWSPLIYELTLRNVMELRDQLSTTVGWLPWIWAFLIKNFIPHVVLLLFINLAQSNSGTVGEPLFGNYGGYEDWPFQWMGYATVFFAFGLFIIGFVAPGLYSGLTLLDEKTLIHGYGQGAPAKELEKMGDELDENSEEEGEKQVPGAKVEMEMEEEA
jgi:hypothetical protein